MLERVYGALLTANIDLVGNRKIDLPEPGDDPSSIIKINKPHLSDQSVGI